MGLILLYLLHTLLEVLLHRQQITWGCLSRAFKNQGGGVGIAPFAITEHGHIDTMSSYY